MADAPFVALRGEPSPQPSPARGEGVAETWALTPEAVRAWAMAAKPGESKIYAKGSLQGVRRSAGVAAAREMCDAGLVTLTSQKLAPEYHAFIAQRLRVTRQPAAPHRQAAAAFDPDTDDLAELMALLRRLAAAGQACPTNREIGVKLGGRSPDQAAYLLRKAQSRGSIRIEAVGIGGRVVTIVSSGKRTRRP